MDDLPPRAGEKNSDEVTGGPPPRPHFLVWLLHEWSFYFMVAGCSLTFVGNFAWKGESGYYLSLLGTLIMMISVSLGHWRGLKVAKTRKHFEKMEKVIGAEIEAFDKIATETMELKQKCRAHFEARTHNPKWTLLIDRDGPVSVTNEAERVVMILLKLMSAPHAIKTRIAYRATGGQWSELAHDGDKFTAFRELTDADRAEIGEEHLT